MVVQRTDNAYRLAYGCFQGYSGAIGSKRDLEHLESGPAGEVTPMHDAAILNNNLLDTLPIDVYQRLRLKLEPVELKFGDTLYGEGDIFTHVYFVESGIISVIAGDGEHATIEVAMIGHEGMAPPPVFLGIKKSTCCAVVQGEGVALRMTVADFHEECAKGEDLSKVMGLFTYSIIMQLSRSAICNRFHSTQSRLARWLLMTHDRMKMDKFLITQQILSYMVGVRREAINKAAGAFQRDGLISYTRGHMHINDRRGLRSLACNCYGMTVNAVPSILAANN